MAEFYLDLVGYVCPVPLMETKKKFQELAAGDVLVIETEHPRAVRNIMDWAWNEGTDVDVDETANGRWKIVLKK
ncbi:MAG: sulfurtransferase TusA family protein [Bacillota bacterium]|jgi:tRNA 2-thiouridine synthesizing protein A|nr:sulfurtransferase TusA family protein [Clostridia bacterium]